MNLAIKIMNLEKIAKWEKVHHREWHATWFHFSEICRKRKQRMGLCFPRPEEKAERVDRAPTWWTGSETTGAGDHIRSKTFKMLNCILGDNLPTYEFYVTNCLKRIFDPQWDLTIIWLSHVYFMDKNTITKARVGC